MEPLLYAGSNACEISGAPSKSGVAPSAVEFLHRRRSSWPTKQHSVLGGLLLLMSDPQTGEVDVGLRALTPVGEALLYNYFPVEGHLPSGSGVW